MRIITNTKKIERNRKIGLFTSLGSLAVLVLGLVLSFNADMLPYAYGALLVGLILSQVGIFFGNRWGRSPRVDERLTAGLKGLDDRFALYHYTTAVPHLLTGPSGLFVLVPQYQKGVITYEKNRFRQAGVNFISRFFAQEGIGRPEMEAQAYQQDMQKFLQKSMPEDEALNVQPVIVFVHPNAKVSVADSPTPALHVEKLKEFIRRKARENNIPQTKLQEIQELLPET